MDTIVHMHHMSQNMQMPATHPIPHASYESHGAHASYQSHDAHGSSVSRELHVSYDPPEPYPCHGSCDAQGLGIHAEKKGENTDLTGRGCDDVQAWERQGKKSNGMPKAPPPKAAAFFERLIRHINSLAETLERMRDMEHVVPGVPEGA
jgi:hypothetical protein